MSEQASVRCCTNSRRRKCKEKARATQRQGKNCVRFPETDEMQAGGKRSCKKGTVIRVSRSFEGFAHTDRVSFCVRRKISSFTFIKRICETQKKERRRE